MSCLLVDVGNTKLKWRYQAGERVEYGSFSVGAACRAGFESIKLEKGVPSEIALACVKSDEYQSQLSNLLFEVFGVEPYVSSVKKYEGGVTCAYQDPGRMGVDRWLAMLAVYERKKSAFCVVDCGSAVTIDWVDAQGRHVGGFIVAGLRLSIEALLSGTDQVLVDFDKLASASLRPGLSTTDAVYNGALCALCSQVEFAYQRLLQITGSDKGVLVVTGGDAKLLSAQLNCPHELAEGLVFDGLELSLRQSR